MAQEDNFSLHDWIVKELCIRFQNKPRICEKKNDTFIGSNPRIVNVHNQTFSYYSMIQQFNDLDVIKLGSAIPKAAVKLKDIESLTFPQKGKKQKNHFTITFPKNKILKYGKDNYETIVNPQAKGLKQWTFQFKYDIVILPQIEQRIRQQNKKNQQNLQKKLEQEEKRIKHLKEQEQKAIQDEKIRQEQYRKFINQQNLLSEQEQYNRNQERERRRLQKEKIINVEVKDEQQKNFQQSFNLQYMKTCAKMPLNELLQIQYNILKIIGDFRVKSIETVKFLVNRFLSQKQTSKFRIGHPNSNEYRIENIIVRIGQKDINQQFLSLATVADVLSVLYRTKEENKMRVPLTCFVKYRNYKCLCVFSYMNDQPNDEIIYGLKEEENIKVNSLISQKLKTISKQLNLKSYQMDINGSRQTVYLDPRCRVYKNKMNPDAFQFITNIKQIFPIDVNLDKYVDQRSVRMRPQFVHSIYNDDPLSAGAFLNSVENAEGDQEDVEVAKASYLLVHQTLPLFVKKLDNLDILLLDSPNIAQALQKNGINVRYIGKIAKLTYLPYVRQSMQVQGIARSIKVLFRKQVRQYTESVAKVQFRAKNPYHRDQVSKQFIDAFDEVSRQVVIDFMNLIFSNTTQTIVYWQQFIKPLCYDKYQFDIKVFPEVCYGSLLHAVLYHCGIKIKFDINIKLFGIQNPFKPSDWIQYTVFSKVYQYPSFEIQKLAKKSTEYKNNDFKDLAIKSLDLELAIQKALRSSEYFQHCALPQQRILIQLSNLIQVKTSDFPINHPSMLQYILANVSEDNFVKANNIAQFSLPPTHPLFISFYMAFSKIYDKKILFKSSAIVAYRSLGPKHHKTCQLLAEIQTDDVEILKKAWVQGGKNNHNIILVITKRLQTIGKIQQCVQYCKRGIQKLDTPSQKTYKALIELSMRAIKVCYMTRNLSYMFHCINYLWKILEQFDNKNEEVYYEMIKYTLKILLEKHTYKSFLYKLVLVIGDVILKYKYIEEVNLGKFIPYSILQLKMASNETETDFFPMVGPEERAIILPDIIKSSRQSKSHVHWLQYTLSQLSMAYNSLNFANDFFTNFQQLTANIHNQDFDEGMQSLELLCKLFGQKLFYHALMRDTFCEAT